MTQKCLSCQAKVSPPFLWKNLVTCSILSNHPLLSIEEWLCKACLEEIPLIEGGCSICSKPLLEEESRFITEVNGEVICYDCERWLKWATENEMDRFLSINISCMMYNEWAQELITRYKFKRDERLKYFFASLLFTRWRRYTDVIIDFIISVPVSEQRLLERGFNQSDLLAKIVSETLKIPYEAHLLMKGNEDEKQSKKDRKGRMEELLKKFIKNPRTTVDIHNKRILVIDDIYTTGATVYAISYILKGLGAKEVISLTLAR